MPETANQTTLEELIRSLARFPASCLPAGVIREIAGYGAEANDLLLERVEAGIDNVHGAIGAVPGECFFCYVLLNTHPDVSMLPTVQRLLELKSADVDQVVGDLQGEFTSSLLTRMTTEANLAVILEWASGIITAAEPGNGTCWPLVCLPVRWFHAGLMSREQAIKQLKQWMQARSNHQYDDLSAACVCSLVDLNAYEEMDFLLDFFQRKLVDTDLVNADFCRTQLSSSCRPVEHDLPVAIDDVVAHLCGWAGFTMVCESLTFSEEATTLVRNNSWSDGCMLAEQSDTAEQSDIDEWFVALRQSNDENYPRAAVDNLSRRVEQVADRLVDEVRWGLEQCGTENARASNGPFLATVMLVVQDDGPGRDVLLDLLDLSPEDQQDIIGDSMYSALIYALSYRLLGDCEPIDQRIEEVDRSELDRGSMAMFYVYSAKHGFVPRDEAIAKLLGLLERFIDDSPELAAQVFDALCLMSVPDDHPVMFAAREKGVKCLFLSEEIARQCIDHPQEASKVLWEQTAGFRNVTKLIGSSVMFDRELLQPLRPVSHTPAISHPSDAPQASKPTTTIVNMPSDNTPRNSPCPCGSGKKYKKCCLKKNR